jgi:hypothetical protein
MIESALNVAVISLSMYKIKEFIKKKKNFVAKPNFDNIHN